MSIIANRISRLQRPSVFPLILAALPFWFSAVRPCEAAETAVDLRASLPAVGHQGSRNTCSAFAATALMEYLIEQDATVHAPVLELRGQAKLLRRIRSRRNSCDLVQEVVEQDAKETVRLSVAYTYWLGKNKAVDSDFLRGMYGEIDGLAGFLAVQGCEFGCMKDAAWPYESQNWEKLKDGRGIGPDGKPLPERFTGVPPKTASLLPYKLKPIFIEKEKIADFLLTQKKPVVFNILWCGKAIDAAGDFRMPTDEEAKSGDGHVILLVGYDKATKRFIFRNSWGEKWGKNGYGTMPEEYVLKYYEVKKFEPIEQHDKATQEFLKTAMMGVSGELIVERYTSSNPIEP